MPKFMSFTSSMQKKAPWKGAREETVGLWQDHFFAQLVHYLFLLGPLLLIPALIMSVRASLLWLAVIDLLAYASIVWIYTSRSLALHHRKIILLSTLYILGVLLLYYLGWNGPGLVYLLGISLFSTLLISARAGYLTWGANIILITGFALLSGHFSYDFMPASEIDALSMMTVALNYFLLNLILLVSISSLLRVLQKKIAAENRVKKRLSTEIKLHQKAREEAEKSGRMKSAFLANVSHEIRTPINGVLGFTEILLNMEVPHEKCIQYLKIIEKSGQHLLHLINELTDISRIESGKINPDPESFDINSLLESLLAFHTHSAVKKQLTLHYEREPKSKPIIVYTDKEKLHAILNNLLANAIKYSDQGTITIACRTSRQQLIFHIQDEGPGIPKEQQSQIFDRFFRVETPENQAKEGTGLGLSIAKSYAELLGGSISLQSKEGQGSLFTVKIPTHCQLSTIPQRQSN